MPRRTLGTTRVRSAFAYGAITLSGRPSQASRLASLNPTTWPEPHPKVVWAVPLSLAATDGIDNYLSFPLGTKMFQFPRSRALSSDDDRQCDATRIGFPHSDIDASSLTSSSAPLFAGSRVLLRLLVPRHSLCAL